MSKASEKSAVDSDRQPVRRKGRERRLQIIEAAKNRLIKAGMSGLVLRDIANEMGITHGNLQYYFATKNDLLRAIFDDEVERFTNGLHEAIESSDDPAERIAAIIDSSVGVLKSKETRLWRILNACADEDKVFAEILKRENDFFEATLANELKEVAPHFSEDRRVQTAKLMRLIIDGLGINFIYLEPDDPAVERLTDEFKRVFIQDLTNDSA